MLLALFSLFSAMFAGFFVGLNAAFTLALRSGLPEDKGSPGDAAGARAAGRPALLAARPGAGPALTLVPAVSGSPWGPS